MTKVELENKLKEDIWFENILFSKTINKKTYNIIIVTRVSCGTCRCWFSVRFNDHQLYSGVELQTAIDIFYEAIEEVAR